MLATFTLTVPESKRLIAKGVKALPEVKEAMEKHKIIVAGGTTNGYVAEELIEKELEKEYYTAGTVSQGLHCSTAPNKRIKSLTLEAGEGQDEDWLDFLGEFTSRDVFIKGANAFDNEGIAGVLAGHPEGGTIGAAIGTLIARGAYLIVPVGLEKRIESVKKASQLVGIDKIDYSYGMKAGLIPVTYGKIVTELEALNILTGVEVEQIAAGGIGESSGAVTLAVEGTEDEVVATMELIKEIKGEPKLEANKKACKDCPNHCNQIKEI